MYKKAANQGFIYMEITAREINENVVILDIDGDIDFKGVAIGKNACTAWVNFDGTTTPPAIRDSFK